MADIENGRCHAKKAPQDGPPLFQSGNIVFQAHHVGWIITGFFTIISMVTSFWLINKHLQWYTNKREQRYIVRILFMVPLYATISFASYLFWNHSTPLLLVRDCYESTVLTSFFYLLLTYLSPDPAEQKEIFRKEGLSRVLDREARKKGEKPKKWMIPLGFVRWKPEDGLYFLQLMKWGVLQYCVIRPTTTLAAVILDYAGLYCEDSWSPGWGHIYIIVIVSISVSIAMYCLVQLYIPVSEYLKPQKPILKLFAIKAVVFLTFWQATVLSFFTMLGLVKDSQYMTADNINIGFGAILETFEMMIFAFLHIRAFTYKPYRTPPDRTPRWRSLAHAMNFKETFRELWAGTVYLARRMRGRETDTLARREAVLEDVFGRTRFEIPGKGVHTKEKSEKSREGDIGDGGWKKNEKGKSNSRSRSKDLAVEVDIDEVVHVGQERQWLGLGDKYAYSLGYPARKERSDGLEEQIEKELAKKGYSLRGLTSQGPSYDLLRTNEFEGTPSGNRRRSQRTSWWRNIYNRLSQPGIDSEFEPGPFPQPTRRTPSRRERSSYHQATRINASNYDFNDPPPPSAIRTYKARRARQNSAFVVPGRVLDPTPSSPGPDFNPHYVPTTSTPAVAHISSDTPSGNSPSRPFPPPNISLSPAPQSVISSKRFSPSPATESSHRDSLLGRVFPYRSEASHSGEALSSVSSPPSSRSHQSRVRLGGDRRVVAHGSVTARSPTVIQRPAVRSEEAINIGIESIGQVSRLPGTVEKVQGAPVTGDQLNDTPPPTRSSHRRDSAHYEPHVVNAERRHRQEPRKGSASKPGKRRPGRLVMPEPLASPETRPHPHSPISSPLLSPSTHTPESTSNAIIPDIDSYSSRLRTYNAAQPLRSRPVSLPTASATPLSQFPDFSISSRQHQSNYDIRQPNFMHKKHRNPRESERPLGESSASPTNRASRSYPSGAPPFNP